MSSLNIYSRKDGRFEGRVYLGRSENGKRRYKSYYGATAEEVRRKHEIAQLSVIPNVTAAKMTVGVLVAEWLLSVRNRVKESTLANYRLKLKNTLYRHSELWAAALSAARKYTVLSMIR